MNTSWIVLLAVHLIGHLKENWECKKSSAVYPLSVSIHCPGCRRSSSPLCCIVNLSLQFSKNPGEHTHLKVSMYLTVYDSCNNCKRIFVVLRLLLDCWIKISALSIISSLVVGYGLSLSQKRITLHLLLPSQKLLMVLMRLQQNFCQGDLGFRFAVDQSTVYQTLHHWIPMLATHLKPLIQWPKTNIGSTVVSRDSKTFLVAPVHINICASFSKVSVNLCMVDLKCINIFCIFWTGYTMNRRTGYAVNYTLKTEELDILCTKELDTQWTKELNM